jgi:sugar phosphate isomerase/epimerase
MKFTRRNFLGTAGVAGLAAVAVEPASAVIEPEPWGIKLGLATYTFRSFDRAKAIEMIKEVKTPWISIKDVHLKIDMPLDEVRAARKEFDAAGLKVTSGGNVDMNSPAKPATEAKGKTAAKPATPARGDEAGLRHSFEYAKAAGLPMMVCAPTHDNIKLIEALVKEYDIRIAIHNHGPEDKHFPTVQSVLDVVRKLDRRCGLCMDVGHSMRTGVDVVKSIADAGDRLFDMHVKDLASATDKASQCDVGDGVMPFPAIFRQLKKMNYQGCVNLEYEINDKNPMPGVQRSFSYMRGVLAGLAS